MMVVKTWLFLMLIENLQAGYYYNDDNKKTWQGAVDECISRGMRLVCIKNNRDYNSVKNHIMKQDNSPDDVWIGLHLLKDTLPFDYGCVDNTVVSFLKWSHDHDEPDYQTSHRCIRLYEGSLKYGTKSCSQEYNFLCEDVPIHGGWSTWNAWSSCSASCGTSNRKRERSCDNPKPRNGGDTCPGSDKENQNCNVPLCPVDGDWSKWKKWTSCDVTCGSSVRHRKRYCNSPSPANGGAMCVGKDQQEEDCGLAQCPVDGQWSSWDEWTFCSASCGSSVRKRTRYCNSPPPTNGGVWCVGNDNEQADCALAKCAVDGQWSSWGEWTHCGITCGNSARKRTRDCNSPSPTNGGDWCFGQNQEQENCALPQCPVDGQWSNWDAWTFCSATCGSSIRNRTRYCNSPPPTNGGVWCVGNDNEQEDCVLAKCAVDGQWSSWGEWTPCGVTCGNSTRNRTRDCNSPPPTNGGNWCFGQDQAQESCVLPQCPGIWSPWDMWSSCNITRCGNGISTRYRSCRDFSSGFLSKSCIGVYMEQIACTVDACPEEGKICIGSLDLFTQNLTNNELQQKVKNITDKLWINKSTLSSTLRKKTSAVDYRSTSQYMGYVSITVLGSLIGLLVIGDLINVALAIITK